MKGTDFKSFVNISKILAQCYTKMITSQFEYNPIFVISLIVTLDSSIYFTIHFEDFVLYDCMVIYISQCLIRLILSFCIFYHEFSRKWIFIFSWIFENVGHSHWLQCKLKGKISQRNDTVFWKISRQILFIVETYTKYKRFQNLSTLFWDNNFWH